MNSVESVMRAANPVPDPHSDIDESAVYSLLVLTRTRSRDVDAKEVTKPVYDRPKNVGRWWVAAVAFAAVVVVGAAVLLIPNGSDSAPATSVETTVVQSASTVASTTTLPEPDEPVLTDTMLAFVAAYESAFNSGDTDAFRDSLDPGAVRVDKRAPELTVSVDVMVEEMTHLHARETKVALVGCVPNEVTMTCTTTFDGPVEQALYGAPITASTTYSVDSAGLLLRVETGGVSMDPSRSEDFYNWMGIAHPEIQQQMIVSGFRQVLAGEDSWIYLEWAPVWAELGRPTG